jgi:allantoate deiminase
MQNNPDRISADIDAIAEFTETPSAGCSRPTFTPQWVAARDYVIDQAKRAGCTHHIDAAGNVHIRPAKILADAKVWLSGSHLDTVPHGGKFDGVIGVIVPLEILRAAHESNTTLPLELIVFAEEEGTTFGLGMLGSRAWCGTLTAKELAAVKNRDDQNCLDAGRPCGVDSSRLPEDRINPANYFGLIEVHIEQGPAMWDRNIRVALVTAINGRRQYTCTIRGVANHAGSTPMSYRQDALAAAADCIVQLERLAGELSPETVLTVGKIVVNPNAVNVIADEATFTIDFRDADNATLDRGATRIGDAVRKIATRRRVQHDLRLTEHQPAVALDNGVLGVLRSAANEIGLPHIAETSSGALHDAAIVATMLPTAMLFVASRGGISHNPDEFSRIEDIATAARIVAKAIQSRVQIREE